MLKNPEDEMQPLLIQPYLLNVSNNRLTIISFKLTSSGSFHMVAFFFTFFNSAFSICQNKNLQHT